MFNSVKSGFWHFLKGLNQQKDIVDLDCKIMFFGGANTWILLETAEFRNREGRFSEDPGYHRIELWVFKNFEAHPTEKCVSSFQASNEEISHSQSFHCGKWTRASWWDSADSLDGCCTPKPMPSHSKC